MQEKEITEFVKSFSQKVSDGTAAVFIGAGLSKAAGYPDWTDLLVDIASSLSLDAKIESDLPALAQYYFNKNGRNELNTLIKNRLSGKEPTEIHEILARIPIHSYWTTNYDNLMESALEGIGRKVDVKRKNEDLPVTIYRADATVYKMHGDISSPQDVVLTQEDYWECNTKRARFITKLTDDMTAQTFLFLGFSFKDPNLDQVLKLLHLTFGDNKRHHFYITAKESEDYNQARQNHFLKNLERHGIKTLLLDRYEEIPTILLRIEQYCRMRTVFISGSANDYKPFTEEEAKDFITRLSGRLVKNGYRVVTGYGLGLGDFVISGAIQELYSNGMVGNIEESLIIRPFPQSVEDEKERKRIWRQYRENTIPLAGIHIIVFGNKLLSGDVVLADGVREEYRIAKDNGLKIVPVGATGFVADELWNEVADDFHNFYPLAHSSPTLRKEFDALSKKPDNIDDLIQSILKFINSIQEE